ncbi:MAG: hypothetical protein D6805_00505 [Planctomycetota bacterium]|nr:MAG: hypothetical protein D6805_00505 [Planctomycetota bacterium]
MVFRWLVAMKHRSKYVVFLMCALGVGYGHSPRLWAQSSQKTSLEFKRRMRLLQERLKSSDRWTRIAAIWALGELGKKWPQACAPLVEALADPDKKARKEALGALRRIGSPAMVYLQKGLEKNSWRIRSHCAYLLGRLAPLSRGSVPRLIELLDDSSPKVRLRAIYALGKMGKYAQKSVDKLLSLLKNSNSIRLQKALLRALGRIAPSSPKVALAILPFFRHQDTSLSRLAQWSLARLGKVSVPFLLPYLQKGKDRDLCLKALAVFAELGKEAKGALYPLTQLLERKDPSLRGAAIRALEAIGPEAAEGLAKAFATSSSPMVQMEIARLLGKIPRRAHVACPALLNALAQQQEGVRQAAMEALVKIRCLQDLKVALKRPAIQRRVVIILARIGPPAAPLARDLVEILPRSPLSSRRLILQAIGKMGRAAFLAAPKLVKFLSEKDIQKEVAYALAQIASPDPAVIAALIRAYPSCTFRARFELARAFCRIENQDFLVIPALLMAMGDKQKMVRRLAARGLQQRREFSYSHLPMLKKLLQTKDPVVRQTAIWAAASLGPKSVEIVRQGLKDPHWQVRWQTLRSLEEWGEDASAAIYDILPLLEDTHPRVQWEALHLWPKLGPKSVHGIPILRRLAQTSKSPKLQSYARICLRLIQQRYKTKKKK